MRIVQLISLIVFTLLAVWYVRPWLKNLNRAEALTALLWVHVFRYVALFTISAQHDGYPISDAAIREIVVGDMGGAAIALAGIFLLRSRTRLGLVLCWLLTIETIVDFAVGIHRKIIEPSTVEIGGILWLILTFFVPLVIATVPLLVWQLYSRRHEPLVR